MLKLVDHYSGLLGALGVTIPRGRDPARRGGRVGRTDGVSEGGEGGEDRFAFERIFRRDCTVCGSDRLWWGTVADEADRRTANGENPGPWLAGLGPDLGIVFGPVLLGLTVWRCEDCGKIGVFGPLQFEP
jgi:hypothetical protein